MAHDEDGSHCPAAEPGAPRAITAAADVGAIGPELVAAGVSYADSRAAVTLLTDAVARSTDGVLLRMRRVSEHALRLELDACSVPRGGWPLELASELSDVWGTHHGTRTRLWVELELSQPAPAQAADA